MTSFIAIGKRGQNVRLAAMSQAGDLMYYRKANIRLCLKTGCLSRELWNEEFYKIIIWKYWTSLEEDVRV